MVEKDEIAIDGCLLARARCWAQIPLRLILNRRDSTRSVNYTYEIQGQSPVLPVLILDHLKK